MLKNTITLSTDAASRSDALRAGLTIAKRRGVLGLDSSVEAIIAALERRERSQSTALGGGRALPHARIDGLRDPVVLDLRMSHAIGWDAGEEVDRVMVVLSPLQNETNIGDSAAHLRGLAAAARVLLRGDH